MKILLNPQQTLQTSWMMNNMDCPEKDCNGTLKHVGANKNNMVYMCDTCYTCADTKDLSFGYAIQEELSEKEKQDMNEYII